MRRWPLALPNVGALGFLQRRGNASATQQGKLCFPQFLTLSSSGLAPLEGETELFFLHQPIAICTSDYLLCSTGFAVLEYDNCHLMLQSDKSWWRWAAGTLAIQPSPRSYGSRSTILPCTWMGSR